MTPDYFIFGLVGLLLVAAIVFTLTHKRTEDGTTRRNDKKTRPTD
ncbi:MAG: hypothetical protein AAGL89_09020 [Pseudomonadota bacterium]